MAGALETRLAELLGGLSLACDLADGFAPETILRITTLAAAIGQRHGLSRGELHDVYYVTLLKYLGCTAFAHEETHEYGGGNDIAVRRTMSLADPAQLVFSLRRIGRGVGGSGPLGRGALAVAKIFGDGVAFGRHARAQCETSIRLAQIVRLGEPVQRALAHACERWDGKGEPARVSEEAIAPAMRVCLVAEVLVLVAEELGAEGAIAELTKRAGKHLDPAIVRTVRRGAPDLVALATSARPFEDFLAAEPQPWTVADRSRIDDVALAFAYAADMKSVFTLGHSTSVARVAERTARALAADDGEIAVVRRAALLHDLGRVAIANTIWDKAGPLSVAEWERARLHAYYTERVLWQAPALREIASVAAASHERLDGRGYHRALPAAMSTRAGRILAAADVHSALREPRPHRRAYSVDEARRILFAEAKEGRLDAAVVRALLDVETGDAPRRAAWPKGLSDREVEVLRHVARGKTNKEIAQALGVSPKKVQHHVAHAYEKVGVESRAAAALFATETGLLLPEGDPPSSR